MENQKHSCAENKTQSFQKHQQTKARMHLLLATTQRQKTSFEPVAETKDQPIWLF